MSSVWKVLYRHRGCVDPDYGTPGSAITLWMDNLGGLMLGMDVGDGEKVIVLPLPDSEVGELTAALNARASH